MLGLGVNAQSESIHRYCIESFRVIRTASRKVCERDSRGMPLPLCSMFERTVVMTRVAPQTWLSATYGP